METTDQVLGRRRVLLGSFLVGVSDRFGISGTAAAHLSIFVGVAAVLGSALILDLVE